MVLDLLTFNLGTFDKLTTVSFSNQRNKPESDDDGFLLSSRLGGPLSDEELAALDEDEKPAYSSDWEAFEAFRKFGKKARNASITEKFVRSLKTLPNDFMEMIEAETGANVRNIWTPNAENCFKRMNAGQLNALYMSLLDLEPDSDKYKSFAKAKKGAKAQMLDGMFNHPEGDDKIGVTADQRKAIDAWVPNFN